MIIKRTMAPYLKSIAKQMPVIAIVGPRQSGKTTLAQTTFKKHVYLSLEDLKIREFAQKDSDLFFQKYHNTHGIILDEIQEVPQLLSYIQVYADKYKKKGYFVLTGSQNFLVNETITQSLAGRVAIFTLLPLSLEELKRARMLPQTLEECIWKGQYPRIYADNLNPINWYPAYIRSYIERDVRSLKNIMNLSAFQRFIGLCAGRIGQLLNITSLANDCGITVTTAKSWLSLLEASYIIFLLQPYYTNIGKRLIKSPKLYFYDTGVACSVLGIESPEELFSYYLRGNLFESFVISELYKERYNKGLSPRLYFWRDKVGNEIDCLQVSANKIIPIEIKAGQTISQDYFKGLHYWDELFKKKANGFIVYAGSENQTRSAGKVINWQSINLITKKK